MGYFCAENTEPELPFDGLTLKKEKSIGNLVTTFRCPGDLVFKIFLFPDSDNFDEKHIVPDIECRPVFPDADSVPWCNSGAVSNFYHIVP